MAKKEAQTDLFVYKLLEEAKINLTYQGSDIKELNEALKNASKKGTNKQGYPEYCGVVKDFVIVIENKADLSKHIKRNENNLISQEQKDIENYALNGALWYAKQIINNQNTYKKVFAIAVSGDSKKHKITPMFIDNGAFIREPLEDIETFMLLNEKKIEDYYRREVLKEESSKQKTKEEIEKIASILHEDLRNYGALDDRNKPLVVAGILLALDEMKVKNLDLDYLNNDSIDTDGFKIYELIKSNLKRSDLAPQVKFDKVLTQFSVIKDTKKINEICEIVDKKGLRINSTPLKHYAKFIKENIFDSIDRIKNSNDYLGIFYSEFMRFSGGDGQTLGIVLTPHHITELFCDLINLKPSDRVLDPCCGTAGFLITAMDYMLLQAKNERQKEEIKKNQLFGFELQSFMFAVATANMVLRGDGKSNLDDEDFLKQNPLRLQEDFRANVGFMNPPYSQGKIDKNLTEIAFSEHLLNSILKDGKVVVIVPQSAMTGKSKEEKIIKESILKNHTLEGVITLNKNTFYGVGTNPCVAVFTAGIPHYKDKIVKFINFEDDGYEVQKHKGLVESIHAQDKKAYLLKVWRDEIEAPSKFCVKTTIEPNDEWLHSFYYFNDEIPTHEEFEKTMADYLTFEFNMITHGRGYLFGLEDKKDEK
ncbi:SAM-dependent DNA methyltransferase [Campylobacter sp. TTU-622]|uniref:HsdM family class I SAM-dependent methyltransferase n=2 Tax=unclassified Campylobacter TaxID=2593542 RepID=UPI001908E657|nr:N-6 DNA methylase [Campylobacter sp. TTU-622]MBK1972680.1 SAM-dependent DNA methyltransferase [Campylobacter sp. TTU-622]